MAQPGSRVCGACTWDAPGTGARADFSASAGQRKGSTHIGEESPQGKLLPSPTRQRLLSAQHLDARDLANDWPQPASPFLPWTRVPFSSDGWAAGAKAPALLPRVCGSETRAMVVAVSEQCKADTALRADVIPCIGPTV